MRSFERETDKGDRYWLGISMSDLFYLGNKVTDSDKFIIYFSLLLNGLLQHLDSHLLPPQAHMDG